MAANVIPAKKGLLSVEEILPGFEPVSILWEGEGAPFTSDQSARWSLRMHQRALAEANAAALWQGRLYIHRERFLEVVRVQALAAYKRRYAPEGANAA